MSFKAISLDNMLSMSLDDIPGGKGSGSPSPGFGGGKSGGKSGAPKPNRARRRSGPTGRQSGNCRVFVGNLPFNVTWQELKAFCGSIGKVNHADIFTAPDGRSKGSGLVEYAFPSDARKAIEQLAGKQLQGRPVQVREDRENGNSGAAPARAARRAGGAGSNSSVKVYVGNLSFDTTWKELKDHMRAAGDVAHADVAEKPNGQSRGWGIVEFASAKAARKAIQTLDGSSLDGRDIVVRADEKTDRGSGGSGSNNSVASSGGVTVDVGNLSFDTTWQGLKEFMRSAGEVIRADVATRDDGKSRGTGTVKFANTAGARRAINTLNGKKLDGRPISVKHLGATGTRVYIGNIPWSLHWSGLKDYLREQGYEPSNVQIPTIPNTTKVKGFALVDFPNKAQAKKAVAHLNSIEMDSRPLYSHIDNN